MVILCGGLGSRLREETEYRPKPMVEIGGKPILWHIMKTYAHHGFTRFILCLGYKGNVIREYFLNYQTLNSDFTIRLGRHSVVESHHASAEEGWTVTLADTGEHTMTGGRVKRVAPYIEGDTFLLTYGDGVADVNLRDLLAFHRSHGKAGTITGVRPGSRFGELVTRGDRVVEFSEKPQVRQGLINGGFFVFKTTVLDRLKPDDSCILEAEPLERLAQDGELKVYEHKGFWHCMDTYRDYQQLNHLWETQKASWKVW